MPDISKRNINICLINTQKKISEFDEFDKPIDHRDNFMWFNTKNDLDNYMALKTVHSQLQNSKHHNYRDVRRFRLKQTLSEYKTLNPDIIKINFKDNSSIVYYYNIEDITFLNDEVAEYQVSLNYIYTYFFDMKKNEIAGMMEKTNFKNQNIDINYVNENSKKVLGDNYDSLYYKGVRRYTFIDKEPPRYIFLAISCRKKPNLVDSALQNPIIPPTSGDTLSDEFMWFIPFDYHGLFVRTEHSSTHLTLAKVSYLFLNGCLKVDFGSGILKDIISLYQYVTSAKFGFASFFDIQEISVIDEPPIWYSIQPNNNIAFSGGSGNMRMLHLEDPNDESEYILNMCETYSSENAKKWHDSHIILTNSQKMNVINKSNFVNFENAILYNKYYVKYYGFMNQINSASFFGSKDDLAINSYYLSKDYKKLSVSTDEEAHEDDIDQLWFNGRKNVDYGIKFNGQVESGTTIGDLKEQSVLSLVDGVTDLASDVASSVPIIGQGLSKGIETVGKGVTDYLPKQMKSLENRGGGVSGYPSASSENITSPWLKFHNECRGMLICEYNNNHKYIDELTSQYGTSCHFFIDDVNSWLNEVIKNRSDKRCFIKGDFNVRVKYPQISQNLKNIFSKGIRFENKVK